MPAHRYRFCARIAPLPTAAWLAALSLIASSLLRPIPARGVQKARNTYTVATPAPADYSKLQWLIGDWSGKTTGKGPQGGVLLSASFALGKRFIILREQLSLPATKAAPATQEQSMGILSGSASGRNYEFDLYSSNGFITQYQVSVGNGEIDFSPEGGIEPPPGWLFRRSIRQTKKQQCIETVDVAPPNEPFFNYYTANLSHTAPQTGANPASTARPKHRGLLFWRRTRKPAIQL
jgi:hypothetical protein